MERTRLMSQKSRVKQEAIAGQFSRCWSSFSSGITPRSTAQCISESHASAPQS